MVRARIGSSSAVRGASPTTDDGSSTWCRRTPPTYIATVPAAGPADVDRKPSPPPAPPSTRAPGPASTRPSASTSVRRLAARLRESGARRWPELIAGGNGRADLVLEVRAGDPANGAHGRLRRPRRAPSTWEEASTGAVRRRHHSCAGSPSVSWPPSSRGTCRSSLIAGEARPGATRGVPPSYIKPAPETPLDALLLAELVDDLDLPPGVVSVLPGGRELGEAKAA